MSANYSSNDFNDIMDSLVLFMKSQDEFTDMNFDGSGIREILRVLAYNAQHQAYQNNFVYNELQIDSAQLRPNVTSIASKLGYTPSSKRAARARVSLVITPSDPDVAATTLTLNRDHQFYATKDGQTYILSPDSEYTANLTNGAYTFDTVTLLQGTWAINGFLVKTQYGTESFVIPNDSVDTNSMDVAVRDSETSATQLVFKRFDTAYDLGIDSALYFVKENRNGLFEFKFGDGKFAKRLNYGNVVTIRYLITEGDGGNDLSLITPASSIGGFYDIKVTNITERTYGGADKEDIDSIRTLAPISFTTSGNAVTPGDYITLTKKLFAESSDVICWGGEDNVPPRFGYVFLSVIPKHSDFLSQAQKDDLISILKKYNVGSVTPLVVDPEYTYVIANSKIKYVPETIRISDVALQQKIQDYCKLFSKDKMEKFGGSLDASRFSEFINNIDPSIKGNYTTLSYEKRFKPTLEIAGSYVIDFSHKLSPGSVVITGFTILDLGHSGATYSIVDSNGTLKMIRDFGNVDTVYSDVGKVDYETGLVTVYNFNPKTLTNGQYVSCSAYSSVDDDQSLLGVRNSILKIEKMNAELVRINK